MCFLGTSQSDFCFLPIQILSDIMWSKMQLLLFKSVLWTKTNDIVNFFSPSINTDGTLSFRWDATESEPV